MAQLAGIYFCSSNSGTSTLTPSEAVQGLLEKHSVRDAILLQLTTCRKLFAELQASTAMYSASNLLCTEHVGFVTKVCQELIHTTEFVPTLVSQLLDNSDQLISYCACKTLSLILCSSQIKADWLDLVSLRINTKSVFTHVAIYSLQVFTEVLKSLRKSSTDNDCQQKQICFAALQPWWAKILQIFAAALAEGNSQNLSTDKLELSLGGFLSLVVETLRHRAPQVNTTGTPVAVESIIHEPEIDSESATSSQTPANSSLSFNAENDAQLTQYSQLLTSCQMSVTCCIPKLASLVQSCGSGFILRRMLDICLRVVELPPPLFEVMTHLKSSLPDILQSQLLNRVLHSWIQQTGTELLNNAVVKLGRSQLESAQNVCHFDHQIETGLVNTVVRKLVLFLLKFAASLMERNGGPDALHFLEELLQPITLSACSVADLQPNDDTVAVMRKVLFQILYEQDDYMIEALLASCKIHQCLISQWHTNQKLEVMPQILQHCFRVCNIHCLFVQFLTSLSFDHSVLLDFLISAETRFREFFRRYLQMLQTNWTGLQLACEQVYPSTSTELDSEGSSASCGEDSSVLLDVGGEDGLKELGQSASVEAVAIASDFDSKDKETCTAMDMLEDASAGATTLVGRKRTRLQCDLTENEAVKKSRAFGTQQPQHAESDVAVATTVGEKATMCSPQHRGDLETVGTSAAVSSLYHETMLEQVMGCLIRLRFALERLHNSGLFPLSGSVTVEEVLFQLEKVETLYEQENS